MRCDQCEAAMINGIFCHEHGCPNACKRYEPAGDVWITQRKCPECGYVVDYDVECCGSDDDTDANEFDDLSPEDERLQDGLRNG